MPRRKLRVKAADSARINAELAELRAALEIRTEWPEAALAEAERAAGAPRLPDHDATELPLFTVDPPGSRDLDQAMHLAHRPGGGYRVHYAIADVAAFVRPGGAIDEEARRRVQTLYFPDRPVALHPTRLSEDAASLLPGEPRPALLWQLDLDEDGAVVLADLRRAVVRSHRRLDYAAVQRAVDAGGADEQLVLLATVGRLREEQERERGGISLPVPEQEVEETPRGYVLGYRAPTPADGWNAQISLLTGMAAAELMLDAGVGLLRTLPAAPPAAFERLGRTARALDIDWPDGLPYPDLVRSLDPDRPLHAAFLNECTGLLRGPPTGPSTPPGAGRRPPTPDTSRWPRRTRTAPRRCADWGTGSPRRSARRSRRGGAAGLGARGAGGRGRAVDGGDRRAGEVERACVDLVEAEVLSGRVGEDFPAVVVDVDAKRPGRGTVQLREPAVRARCDRAAPGPGAGTGAVADGESPGTALPLGGRIAARLTVADPATRTVRFTAV